MYWWNISALITSFKENKVTVTDQKNYLLLAFLLLTLVPLVQIGSFLEIFVTSIVVIFGISFAYAMSNKNNPQFALQFIALSCPIGIRVILIRMLVVIVEIAMIASTMLAPFTYKRIRGVPIKYAAKFLIDLPAKIMNVIYNPPLELGTTWFIFHRLIPLILQLLFFVWVAICIRIIAKNVKGIKSA